MEQRSDHQLETQLRHQLSVESRERLVAMDPTRWQIGPATVHRAEFFVDTGVIVINAVGTGRVEASVYDDHQRRQVRVFLDHEPITGFCTCGADTYPCAHVFAVLTKLQAELKTADAFRPVAGFGPATDAAAPSERRRTAEHQTDLAPAAVQGAPAWAAADRVGGTENAGGTENVGGTENAGAEAVTVADAAPEDSRLVRFNPGAMISTTLLRADAAVVSERTVGVAASHRLWLTDLGPLAAERPHAAYRLAFRLETRPQPTHEAGVRYSFVPVLVYIRRDGNDGRVLRYTTGQSYRPPDPRTQQVLRSVLARPTQELSAAAVISRFSSSSRRGNRRFNLPDNVMQMPGPVEAALPVILRRIERVRLSWRPVYGVRNEVEFEPVVHLVDVTGHSEILRDPLTGDAVEVPAELHENGVFSANLRTGALWYLFDSDVDERRRRGIKRRRIGTDMPLFVAANTAGADGSADTDTDTGTDAAAAAGTDGTAAADTDTDEVADEAAGAAAVVLPRLFEVLSLREPLTYHDARDVYDACRRRLQGFAVVDQPPTQVAVVVAAPVPVVTFGGRSAAGSTGSVTLQYRYGNTIVDAHDRRLHTLPGESADGDKPATMLVRSLEAEAYFWNRLIGVISSVTRYNIGEVTGGASETAAKTIACERGPLELVVEIGRSLIGAGYELTVWERRLSGIAIKTAFRVTQSGPTWLEIEPGIQTLDDDFLPVDSVVNGRLVSSRDRVYLLTTPDDVEVLSRRFRVDRRDFAGIAALFGTIANPDHAALSEFRDMKERVSQFRRIEPIEPPPTFKGQLRPYQKEGLAWLWFLHRNRLGGILADDMGLGKTIQALALLTTARAQGQMRRALVVCPVSTMGNWQNEINRFTPSFVAIINGGVQRHRRTDDVANADIVVMSYDTLVRDAPDIAAVAWDYVILDEAQAIKNVGSKRRAAVTEIPAHHRIAMTGTPVENSAFELWSLLDFSMPAVLGSSSEFARRFAGIETAKPEALARLAEVIRPFILRRTKSQVADDLPPREDKTLYVEMGRHQSAVYESLRRRLAADIEQRLQSGWEGPGSAAGNRLAGQTRMVVLEALLRLRQAAILPALVNRSFNEVPSAKLDLLVDLIDEINAEGNKLLVFSQFTSVLDAIEKRLSAAPIKRFRLDGSVTQAERTDRIAAFQAHPASACFLISLKAGGVGINLTAADYVLIMDPWWNPAVEAQAIDRAHRIGRVGSVFAYRIVAKGTIEAKILRLQERKKAVAQALIREESQGLRNLSADDVLDLFGKEEPNE